MRPRSAIGAALAVSAAACASGSLFSCERSEPDARVREASADAARGIGEPRMKPASARVVIPHEGGAFRPALARVVGEGGAQAVANSGACISCHAAIGEEWGGSAHAWASLSNPIYAASFQAFLAERGPTNTRFCAGCHDPALLFDASGALSDDPTPLGAHAGIGCASCHAVSAAERSGNGSYTLAAAPIPEPRDGDAISLAIHRARATTKKVDRVSLCVSCHRGTLTPEMGHEVALPGLDEYGPWRASPYNKNATRRIDPGVEPADCVGCHMPTIDGRASHRFLGGHTALGAMLGDQDAVKAQSDISEGAITMQIMVGAGASKAARARGDRAIDVVLFNEKVGHNYPGGARDLRDAWVELELHVGGRIVARSGADHAAGLAEPGVYRLHVRLADAQGGAERDHQVAHFRAPIYDHTLAPRSAAVARYLVPASISERGPIEVRARLRQRRLSIEAARARCAFARSEPGRAASRAARRWRGRAPDGCVPQPIVEIAHAEATLERAANGALRLERPQPWRWHYRHGLGLLAQLQERLGEAERSFARARDALERDAAPIERAAVEQGLGMVDALSGRPAEAERHLERAAELAPGQPSNAYWRARAFLTAWRFESGRAALEEALALQVDAELLSRLAVARASQGDHAGALDAAHRAMEHEPRDPSLLRVQWLALGALGAPEEQVRAALKAYDAYKRDPKAHKVRDRCAALDAECAAERVPIRERPLALVPE